MDRNQNGLLQDILGEKLFQMDRNNNGVLQAFSRDYPGVICVLLCLLGRNMYFVVQKQHFGGVGVLLCKNGKLDEVCV